MNLILALIFAYFVFFPFGQLAKLPLQLTEVNIYIVDVLVFLILASWVIWRLLKKKPKFILPPLFLPMFLFSIIALVSLGFNSPLLKNREVVVAGLYLLRLISYFGFYLALSDILKQFKQLNQQKLLKSLVIIGASIAFFGFVQYLLWPNLKALEVLEWDPHYYRLVSTFLDPGFTGLILVLTLIILINLLFENKKNLWLILAMGIIYLALILTHSRSSYLAFLVGIGLIAWLRKNIRMFFVALLILVLSLAILPQPKGEGGRLARTYTIQYRLKNWQNALTIIKDHPLLGVGFNAYRYAQRDYGFLKEEKWQVTHSGAGADSSLLFVLATTGIFGLASYLWYLVGAGALAFYQRKKIIGIVCLASLGAAVAHSFFLNSLFYPWVIGWLAILLACL